MQQGMLPDMVEQLCRRMSAHRQHHDDVVEQVNAAIVPKMHKVILNGVCVQQLSGLEANLHWLIAVVSMWLAA